MKIRRHQQDGARTVDEILDELVQHRSHKQIARSCSTTERTARSWHLNRGELAIPREPARAKLAALVDKHLGGGTRASLESAWNSLTAEPTRQSLLSGDEAAEARVGLSARSGQLSLQQRLLIVRQARLVFEQAYAHLTFKRARHAVNPVQRLRLLEYRLAAADEDTLDPEVVFHREMIDIFTSTRDLHTSYVAPGKYQQAVLTLPFIIEEFFDPAPGGKLQAVYVASKVETHEANPEFRDGVRITHWNAVPIDRAIEVLAEKQAAGNRPAALARSIDALTQRPLLSTMVPDAAWVDVTFEPEAGRTETARFTWTHEKFPEELLDDLHLRVPLGIDAQTDAVSELRKEKYGRKRTGLWTRAQERDGVLATPIALADFHLETQMPWFFRAHTTRDQRFGYVRLYKFKTRNAVAFAQEFARLIAQLPTDGLIIDARGNPGGNIQAAECALQVLSADPIRPLRAQFTTSPLLLSICKANPVASRRGPGLGPWIDSLAQAVSTGSAFSRGYELTPPDMLEQVRGDGDGDGYGGPIVLIVDAHCYSATDMFAAGFIDHRLGKVLGTADNTGAGGANVWRHSDLVRLAGDDFVGADARLERLPAGVDIRVAVRRTTRVNDHEGEILEDLGIEIDQRHHMTRRDVFEGNRDLIDSATKLLG